VVARDTFEIDLCRGRDAASHCECEYTRFALGSGGTIDVILKLLLPRLKKGVGITSHCTLSIRQEKHYLLAVRGVREIGIASIIHRFIKEVEYANETGFEVCSAPWS
jgi:hypothetical protein